MQTFLKKIRCKFCKEGAMQYSQKRTFENYCLEESFVLDDIDKIIDGIINEYLVYVCSKCGSIEKYTHKELERLERKRISKIVMTLMAKKEIDKAVSRHKNTVLIYCGKCSGLDGKGGCLLKTFKECKLKKLPDEL